MDNHNKGKIRWILDNGHGVETPGNRSPMLTDGRQFLEYRFARQIVTHINTLLMRKNLDSFQLVPEDHDVPLATRVNRANTLYNLKPCVLVSVHSNAYGDCKSFTVPRDIESYYYKTSEAGRRIAEVFQENLIQATGWRDRGVRKGVCTILRKTTMPAIITENGFYTNREQCEYLLDPDCRERIAEAHVEAITEIEEMGPAFFQTKNDRYVREA